MSDVNEPPVTGGIDRETANDAWGVHPRPDAPPLRSAAMQLVVGDLKDGEQIVGLHASATGVFIATNLRAFKLERSPSGYLFVPVQFATYQPVT